VRQGKGGVGRSVPRNGGRRRERGGARVVARPWCRDGSGRWGAGDAVRCS
jgi:hypothetical protein